MSSQIVDVAAREAAIEEQRRRVDMAFVAFDNEIRRLQETVLNLQMVADGFRKLARPTANVVEEQGGLCNVS